MFDLFILETCPYCIKVMEFISIIPKVDKEVAMSIINQFPNYADMAKDMVGGMISLCDNALKDASGGRKEVIESYKLVLETKREELSKNAGNLCRNCRYFKKIVFGEQKSYENLFCF